MRNFTKITTVALTVLMLLGLAFAVSCGDDDHDDSGGGDAPAVDDDLNDDDIDDDSDDDANDDLNDDADDDANDDADDDIDDDVDDDDPIVFDPWDNPTAAADAFRLYYKERIARTLIAYNRFMLVNDVVPAHTLGATHIAKSGGDYDVHLHPKDNNDIGHSAFNAWHAYKVFGSRDLALTLIRQFEGLAVAEEVSGISGLTCREWQPGFVLTIDGLAGTVERTKYGIPTDAAEDYPVALEDEIVQAFFADGVYTYRGDPSEYYFNIEPILNPGAYALTFVHEEMPDFLRVSDCCSSFMVSKLGTFGGYFWGNHNSRDNFPDYARGYFAACQAMDDPDADADVIASAARACASGQRIGDSVVDNGYNLMTVQEFEPYDEANLIVAGEIRPDGTDEGLEWLGSMNSCQMSYMAKALSTQGLSSADEIVESPGAYEILAVKFLFEYFGLQPPDIAKTCSHIDDAYIGMGWGELLDLSLFDIPMWDIFEGLLNAFPDEIVEVLKTLADATHQPEESAAALVYYAQGLSDNAELLQQSRETLFHILEIQRRSARLIYDWAQGQPVPPQDVINKAVDEMIKAARYAHIAGVGNEDYDSFGFAEDEYGNAQFEAVLQRGDSNPRPLRTDDEIWAIIESELQDNEDRPLTYDRYLERFPTPEDMPLRRFDDHYEAVGLDGEFHEIPNISHQGFGGGADLWNTLPNCALAPSVLDCRWAVLGCERPDLNADGAVDAADQALFDAAWAAHGEGAACDDGNAWCDGADLDQNGALEQEDADFISAAQGCWYEAV
jgi:hypothetical protein